MTYHEIKPGKSLQPYVKCYYVYRSGTPAAFEDTVFPSGCTEIIFNLGSGNWHTFNGESFITTPTIELWGQLMRPLSIRSTGRNTMLGIRFLPQGAAAILNDDISLFNNQVISFSDINGKAVTSLHNQLQETRSWNKRIALVETFLLQQLLLSTKRLPKLAVINNLMYELRQQDVPLTMETMANRYGITARYMQQLFLQHTGLTPKLYTQISRFQKSLQLVTAGDISLTAIAYECGYADQSHFIKEFKSFTGYTPSGYSRANSPVTMAATQTTQEPREVI
ncbi:MAG TPA: helix-turn-helix transcriptional regulator [Niastella sp.]|nr:helix-turn-helix transcriptional regulator [Niastella sp.]